MPKQLTHEVGTLMLTNSRKPVLVRISPTAKFIRGAGKSSRGSSQNFGRAVLVSVEKNHAVVRPMGGHAKTERVRLHECRVWPTMLDESVRKLVEPLL